jgi:hypothetical protein
MMGKEGCDEGSGKWEDSGGVMALSLVRDDGRC